MKRYLAFLLLFTTLTFVGCNGEEEPATPKTMIKTGVTTSQTDIVDGLTNLANISIDKESFINQGIDFLVQYSADFLLGGTKAALYLDYKNFSIEDFRTTVVYSVLSDFYDLVMSNRDTSYLDYWNVISSAFNYLYDDIQVWILSSVGNFFDIDASPVLSLLGYDVDITGLDQDLLHLLLFVNEKGFSSASISALWDYDYEFSFASITTIIAYFSSDNLDTNLTYSSLLDLNISQVGSDLATTLLTYDFSALDINYTSLNVEILSKLLDLNDTNLSSITSAITLDVTALPTNLGEELVSLAINSTNATDFINKAVDNLLPLLAGTLLSDEAVTALIADGTITTMIKENTQLIEAMSAFYTLAQTSPTPEEIDTSLTNVYGSIEDILSAWLVSQLFN